MSRILELGPEDEHTIASRVLVELHQAIDANFPHTAPSTKQFTKTLLTGQAPIDVTRVDQASPGTASVRGHAPPGALPAKGAAHHDGPPALTPPVLHTSDLKKLMDGGPIGGLISQVLWLALIIGTIILVYVVANGMGWLTDVP